MILMLQKEMNLIFKRRQVIEGNKKSTENKLRNKSISSM